MAVQPGWYQDPSGDTRYWDGQVWTDVVVSPVPSGGTQRRGAPWAAGPRTAMLVSIGVLLGADLVVGASVVTAAVDPTLRSYLLTEESSAVVADGYRLLVLTVAGLASLVWYAALLLSGVLAMVWTWQVRANAEALGQTQHSLARGWAWAGWITPIVSLWFPNQVIRDIDRADKQALSARTGVPSTRPPINAWWAFFLGYWLVGQATGSFPAYSWGHVAAYLLSSAAGVVALVLFCRVTRIIQDDQEVAHSQPLPVSVGEVATPERQLVSITG